MPADSLLSAVLGIVAALHHFLSLIYHIFGHSLSLAVAFLFLQMLIEKLFALLMIEPGGNFSCHLAWGSFIALSCLSYRVDLPSYLVLEKNLVESAILVFAQLPSGICITLPLGKNRVIFSEEEVGIMLMVSKASRVMATIL